MTIKTTLSTLLTVKLGQKNTPESMRKHANTVEIVPEVISIPVSGMYTVADAAV